MTLPTPSSVGIWHSPIQLDRHWFLIGDGMWLNQRQYKTHVFYLWKDLNYWFSFGAYQRIVCSPIIACCQLDFTGIDSAWENRGASERTQDMLSLWYYLCPQIQACLEFLPSEPALSSDLTRYGLILVCSQGSWLRWRKEIQLRQSLCDAVWHPCANGGSRVSRETREEQDCHMTCVTWHAVGTGPPNSCEAHAQIPFLMEKLHYWKANWLPNG